MTLAYYNEIDPFAAQWLRNLIAAAHIAPGDVDERSIVDVRPADLRGYTQCHFFAGIGGWSLAARLAGWPDDKPLWTGSCPCQPFSAAGKRKGTADERHLWPVFGALISECRPSVVVGEQVASKDGLGWLDGVCADLEAADYAVWAGDFCAASVGAPHIRQRLWWLGHADDAGSQGFDERRDGADQRAARSPGLDDGLADATRERERPDRFRRDSGEGFVVVRPGTRGHRSDDGATCDGLEHAARDGREQRRAEPSGRCAAGGCGEGDGLAHADEGQRGSRGPRPGAAGGAHAQPTGRGSVSGLDDSNGARHARPRSGEPGEQEGRSGLLSVGREVSDTFWSRYELAPCRDGTARRIEPGVFPLAHGVSGRVGRLRAYGNAIVPQVAAEILRAYLEGISS